MFSSCISSTSLHDNCPPHDSPRWRRRLCTSRMCAARVTFFLTCARRFPTVVRRAFYLPATTAPTQPNPTLAFCKHQMDPGENSCGRKLRTTAVEIARREEKGKKDGKRCGGNERKEMQTKGGKGRRIRRKRRMRMDSYEFTLAELQSG